MSTTPGPRLTGRRRDLAVTVLLLATSYAPGVFRQVTGEPIPWYGWLLLTAGPLAFPFWRRYPRTVMLFSVAAVFSSAHLGTGVLPMVPGLVAIALSMYLGYRRLTVGTVAVVSFLVSWGSWTSAGYEVTADVVQRSLLIIGWLHVAIISGWSRRQRDAYMAEAEHTREEAVKRKAADERVRIARELHDSLTHSISVIRVQAGVALHLARKRGEDPPPALVAVEEAAKDATRELRETLTMLRDDEGHRLSRAKDLVARYRGLGFTIDLECEVDDVSVIDEEVDHAAYRIVQEALTNAMRHSSGDRVQVRVRNGEGVIEIEVVDNGDAAAVVPGRGITGMRERVDALGGTLHVGPDGHGFAVRAVLPNEAAAAVPAQVGAEQGEAR
jgi:signal transduction histidine kinase